MNSQISVRIVLPLARTRVIARSDRPKSNKEPARLQFRGPHAAAHKIRSDTLDRAHAAHISSEHVQYATKLNLSVQERFLNLPNMGKVSCFFRGVSDNDAAKVKSIFNLRNKNSAILLSNQLATGPSQVRLARRRS